jgi:hypothetical protein
MRQWIRLWGSVEAGAVSGLRGLQRQTEFVYDRREHFDCYSGVAEIPFAFSQATF